MTKWFQSRRRLERSFCPLPRKCKPPTSSRLDKESLMASTHLHYGLYTRFKNCSSQEGNVNIGLNTTDYSPAFSGSNTKTFHSLTRASAWGGNPTLTLSFRGLRQKASAQFHKLEWQAAGCWRDLLVQANHSILQRQVGSRSHALPADGETFFDLVRDGAALSNSKTLCLSFKTRKLKRGPCKEMRLKQPFVRC